MDAATIIGYAATVTLLLGYLPQTIRTIRTRSTDDIAMGTFSMMGNHPKQAVWVGMKKISRGLFVRFFVVVW